MFGPSGMFGWFPLNHIRLPQDRLSSSPGSQECTPDSWGLGIYLFFSLISLTANLLVFIYKDAKLTLSTMLTILGFLLADPEISSSRLSFTFYMIVSRQRYMTLYTGWEFQRVSSPISSSSHIRQASNRLNKYHLLIGFPFHVNVPFKHDETPHYTSLIFWICIVDADAKAEIHEFSFARSIDRIERCKQKACSIWVRSFP